MICIANKKISSKSVDNLLRQLQNVSLCRSANSKESRIQDPRTNPDSRQNLIDSSHRPRPTSQQNFVKIRSFILEKFYSQEMITHGQTEGQTDTHAQQYIINRRAPAGRAADNYAGNCLRVRFS